MADEERRLSDYYKPGAFGQRRRIGKSPFNTNKAVAAANKQLEYSKKYNGSYPREHPEVFLRHYGILYVTPEQ